MLYDARITWLGVYSVSHTHVNGSRVRLIVVFCHQVSEIQLILITCRFLFPGVFISVLAVSEQAEQAVVTSTLVLWRSIGTVLGVASSSLVVQNALLLYLEDYVQGPEKESVSSYPRHDLCEKDRSLIHYRLSSKSEARSAQSASWSNPIEDRSLMLMRYQYDVRLWFLQFSLS